MTVTIEDFDQSIIYVNRLGLGCRPGFPGWIIVAQGRLADAAHKLWEAADKSYPFTAHYHRKERRFTVNGKKEVQL